ncbi:hypothetical protein [Brevundimonas sp.]|uniref:hypothetical protein n=1 Tax=Brevundimonas sp. TaxID=1871086 RepID=UPI003D0DE0AC
MAIDLGVFLTDGFLHGFTPGLATQFLGVIGKQLSVGWFVVIAFAAMVSFGAWIIIQRAKSTSGPTRLVLLSLAMLVAALLPAGLALVVFGKPFLGLVVVGAVSSAAVFIASRDGHSAHVSISTDLSAAQREGFGQRGR